MELTDLQGILAQDLQGVLTLGSRRSAIDRNGYYDHKPIKKVKAVGLKNGRVMHRYSNKQ